MSQKWGGPEVQSVNFLSMSNHPNAPSPAQYFIKLAAPEKTVVLSTLIHWFTLVIREALLSPLDDAAIRRIRGVGEMTHVIASYIIALNSNNNDRYLDEELIELLFASASDYGLSGVLQQAWSNAASQLSPP
jgi:hypothetical protein